MYLQRHPLHWFWTLPDVRSSVSSLLFRSDISYRALVSREFLHGQCQAETKHQVRPPIRFSISNKVGGMGAIDITSSIAWAPPWPWSNRIFSWVFHIGFTFNEIRRVYLRGRNGCAASPIRQLLPLIQVRRAFRSRSLHSFIDSGSAIESNDFIAGENSSKTRSKFSCEPATFHPVLIC